MSENHLDTTLEEEENSEIAGVEDLEMAELKEKEMGKNKELHFLDADGL